MTKGLDELEPLIGEWTVESPTFSEGRGRMIVAPTEDGKFIRQESRVDDQRFRQLTQLIGGDDASDEFTALYFDSRGVRRVYQMTISDGVWRVWREAPGFNQRYIGKISDDGRTITGRWEMSEDGTNWKVDFDLNYKKVAG